MFIRKHEGSKWGIAHFWGQVVFFPRGRNCDCQGRCLRGVFVNTPTHTNYHHPHQGTVVRCPLIANRLQQSRPGESSWPWGGVGGQAIEGSRFLCPWGRLYHPSSSPSSPLITVFQFLLLEWNLWLTFCRSSLARQPNRARTALWGGRHRCPVSGLLGAMRPQPQILPPSTAPVRLGGPLD